MFAVRIKLIHDLQDVLNHTEQIMNEIDRGEGLINGVRARLQLNEIRTKLAEISNELQVKILEKCNSTDWRTK